MLLRLQLKLNAFFFFNEHKKSISCHFSPSGECGAGLGQHIWTEHHEHGEGA